MKKKYLLLIAVAAMIAVAVVGGTLASGYVESGNVLEEISEKALGISIMSGSTKSGSGSANAGIDVVPGGTTQLDYRIQNDQKNGYNLYAKVDLYFGWSSDSLVADQERNGYVSLQLANHTLPLVSSYDRQTKVGDWIVAYCDREQATLYYTRPLSYGDSAAFLDSISFSNAMGNSYAGAQFLLDMDVTAVQANNSEEAIAAEWGVYPHFDNGTLISVSETR
ncbi:MAG: hypothetical protein PUA77_02985 [Lachnospiraceae bacterium]|nr:hypothetical protein [Lachnospiraceae bacterium]